MGNRLKRMLDKKDNGVSLSFSFNNEGDKEKFLKALNKVEKTGMSQEIDVPASMELKLISGDFQYPFDSIDDFVNMRLYPSKDIADFSIIVDGKKEKYLFSRTIDNDYINLVSLNNKIIEVKLNIFLPENKINFSYSTHPLNACSVNELLSEFKRFSALLDVLFKKGKDIGEIDDIRRYFKKSFDAYRRAKEIADVLGIKLTPKLLIEEEDKDFIIEKIYLLLVKNSILRQSDRLNNITLAEVKEMEIGKELFAAYFQVYELEIFDEKRLVYTVNYIFGAEIKKIEKKDDGSKIIYFKDSEKRPMYRSYKAFLDENIALKEMEKILDKKNQYENAVLWTEQIRDLLDY